LCIPLLDAGGESSFCDIEVARRIHSKALNGRIDGAERLPGLGDQRPTTLDVLLLDGSCIAIGDIVVAGCIHCEGRGGEKPQPSYYGPVSLGVTFLNAAKDRVSDVEVAPAVHREGLRGLDLTKRRASGGDN
jgi:hypothetical protein